METKPLPLLLDERAAAAFSGINMYTMRCMRRERRGPPVVKIGRLVRFRPADLIAFAAEHLVQPSELPAVRRAR